MQIALIQFREVGKKYYFSFSNNLDINIDDQVVVETTVGLEIGTIYGFKDETEKEVINALKPIIRIANKNDLTNKTQNEIEEKEINQVVSNLVEELKLNMKILESEYTLDKTKLTIYFEADERVDFRELVRRTSTIYQTRIELRQIGPRDAAKRIGGIGPCGLVLCCSRFIGDFEPVTIRMAKNQSLTLNPKKISGVCGKLLCCLKFEDDIYTDLRNIMPDVYSKINTANGKATVMDVNFISSKIKLKYQNNDFADEWITLSDLESLS